MLGVRYIFVIFEGDIKWQETFSSPRAATAVSGLEFRLKAELRLRLELNDTKVYVLKCEPSSEPLHISAN